MPPVLSLSSLGWPLALKQHRVVDEAIEPAGWCKQRDKHAGPSAETVDEPGKRLRDWRFGW